MAKKKSAFIICPVRNASEKVKIFLDSYVAELERQGYKVHYPPRDTEQSDPTGVQICDTNLSAILESDEIHIYYEPESQGVHFDFGGLYMLVRILEHNKRIVFINRDAFPKDDGVKSYAKVLWHLHKTTN